MELVQLKAALKHPQLQGCSTASSPESPVLGLKCSAISLFGAKDSSFQESWWNSRAGLAEEEAAWRGTDLPCATVCLPRPCQGGAAALGCTLSPQILHRSHPRHLSQALIRMDVKRCCRAAFEGAFNGGGRVLKHKEHSASPAKLMVCSTKGSEEHLSEVRALINS